MCLPNNLIGIILLKSQMHQDLINIFSSSIPAAHLQNTVQLISRHNIFCKKLFERMSYIPHNPNLIPVYIYTRSNIILPKYFERIILNDSIFLKILAYIFIRIHRTSPHSRSHMMNHTKYRLIRIHRNQLNIRMLILKYPEHLICESLSHKINPAKVQFYLPELFQAI